MKLLTLGTSTTMTNLTASTFYTIGTEWMQPKEIHAEWTETTVSATISLQVSFDGSTWTDTETPTAMSGATAKTWINTRYVPHMRVRVEYTSGAVDTLIIYTASLAH